MNLYFHYDKKFLTNKYVHAEVDSYSWLFLILASALTAVAASIAYQATATGMAMRSVIYSSIAISRPYRNSNGISQVKMHRLALNI
jgi:hypothetical protein